MHHGEDLIVLGILFVVAYVLGRLGKTIGLPAIPIYMVVGLLASPHTDWFPLDFESEYIELTAVFGLILLLFNLGLEFDQEEFFANAGKLIISGGSYILVNMAAGLGFGFLVGWGTQEALIIAGITATSSSAIVTKLLIELKRLANPETPMILGVTVVEDIFIAIYLAIVSVVLSGETELWPVVGKLAIAFAFLVVMFSVARWGGRFVSRIFKTKDDELFTILFFGLAILFGGIGEILGVTDAIGAFLIGLVIGATRFRSRVEHIAIPLRDVFGAFFFVNFGLGLDPSAFPSVLLPVGAAVLMTIVLNLGAGQFVAWLNKLGPRAGLNAAFILHNRGEFALILATLSLAAGLNPLIQPFAGLYVLVMAIIGPILASRSEAIGDAVFRRRGPRSAPTGRSAMANEEFALVAAAMDDDSTRAPEFDGVPVESGRADASTAAAESVRDLGERGRARTPEEDDGDVSDPSVAALIEQAMAQSDGDGRPAPVRPREPDY
ncbi:cation:proton antiporter [Microbacteriaceae bacterium VKM Ac-2855]|nr:cation:proton antiporter [Microbacteriaceae bacterium VKM Ac-2855]